MFIVKIQSNMQELPVDLSVTNLGDVNITVTIDINKSFSVVEAHRDQTDGLAVCFVDCIKPK